MFKASAKFVGYSILWDMIGASLMILGSGMSGAFGVFTGAAASSPYQVVDGYIVLIFGLVIMLLGNIATFFKINTDIKAEEIGEHFQSNEEPETPTIGN